MVPQEAPYPDVYTDTFIFFLRPLCKIIWINVHYFPNAPRTSSLHIQTTCSCFSLQEADVYHKLEPDVVAKEILASHDSDKVGYSSVCVFVGGGVNQI